ncbi:hypothetical protein UFOVP75_50 [uncultured Caudovirales phage]|uniref:Uncharacterized protein n=1 Tax=uncultured Caudovirales phage TaxID=2100421 RepID=A0A6J5L4Y7_9CAUD|nr:hypothetical protein UFOVP75_50 [uncultured Caudovirales phage]
MSGGSWDYAYHKIRDIAHHLEDGTALRDSEAVNFEFPSQHEARKKLAPIVFALADVMRTIEWVDSSDSSPPEDVDAINNFLAMIRVQG